MEKVIINDNGRVAARERFSRLAPLLLKILVGISIACAFLLTLTVGDYYIFNRIGEYGFFFCFSQWVKKAGLLMLTLGVFFGCKSLRDCVKYILPLFIILSCALFGNFFDIIPEVADGDTNRLIFRELNLFFPKWLNMSLYFIQCITLAAACGLLIYTDGVKVRAKSFAYLPLALVAAMPLNIFENFFNIDDIPMDSFLRFYNFTIWHFLALCAMIACSVGFYYFLKNKPKEVQDKWLTAIAVTLLLQYHSKDSVVLGDGYNVYNTIFACLPLFICNIGVYVASISVILKKRILYDMSFFIHTVGALTVFVYFGKDSMSNYGIFCSYSILYFCLTHCLLFALCVLPSALGHYKFSIKHCWKSLIYYFIVIVVASLASTLISSFSVEWTNAAGEHLVYDGLYVTGSLTDGAIGGAGFMRPNYAFTQVNPLPFDVPNLIPLGGVLQYLNIFYVMLVYIAYVCLFFGFFGLYQAYLAVRVQLFKKLAARRVAAGNGAGESVVGEYAVAEAATTDGETDDSREREALDTKTEADEADDEPIAEN